MYTSSHTCIGSGLPFRVGQILNPYPRPLQPGIRFFQHPLPALPLSFLAEDRLPMGEKYRLTTFHIIHKQVDLGCLCIPTRNYRCVGSPSKLTNLPGIAVLALGRNGGSSPAPFTIRNTKASLTLPISTILQGSSECATHR